MTRRPSFVPEIPLAEVGRRSLSTLPEIVSLLDDGARGSNPPPRPARSEPVAVVASEWVGVIRRVAADGRWPATTHRVLDDVPATNGALVVVIAGDVVGRDGDGALRRLRGRAPAAKFVFLAGRQDDEKSRSLAVWGAVLPPSADMERVDRAVRHASALSTMSAEMRRLKESGRLGTPSFPPPGSDES